MKLIVSIDTEGDNQWDHGRRLTTENVCYWQPFQKLCEQYELPPTYLITSEITTDPRAIAFLRPLVEGRRAEVGGHLHPWTTPPFRDEPGLHFNDCVHLFPSQLDPQFLQEKLSTLTGQITGVIGRAPTSFRAGRFGYNIACAETLGKLGYHVDSSVTPFISWAQIGGPDFRQYPVHPYWAIEDHNKKLLEIPLTILFTNRWLRRFQWLNQFYNFRIRKLSEYTRLKRQFSHQPLWLRPFPWTTDKDLKLLWNEAERLGLSTLVMMLHSSELMPGGSPYNPTQESVDKILNVIGSFFRFFKENKGEGITLSETTRLVTQETQQEGHS